MLHEHIHKSFANTLDCHAYFAAKSGYIGFSLISNCRLSFLRAQATFTGLVMVFENFIYFRLVAHVGIFRY